MATFHWLNLSFKTLFGFLHDLLNKILNLTLCSTLIIQIMANSFRHLPDLYLFIVSSFCNIYFLYSCYFYKNYYHIIFLFHIYLFINRLEISNLHFYETFHLIQFYLMSYLFQVICFNVFYQVKVIHFICSIFSKNLFVLFFSYALV